jgi:hypothetical protein
MIIAVHQPNYLPYLGFFDKMMKSDIFVIYDDAQFSKEDFHHRNKIRICQGWKWLTVPVYKKRIPISEILIKNELKTWKGANWNDTHFKDIRDNYKNTPFYKCYESEIEKIYNMRFNKLADLNISIILFLKKAFDIETKIEYSSDLVKSEKVNSKSRSSEKLLEIVEATGGNVYLSGPKGRNYLNYSLFKKKEIKIEFQDFKHPLYKQYYEGFEPNMAAIDALFNIGEMSK